MLVLILLGLGLRAYHYLRGPTVWHDEAAVLVNVLDKNYLELLGPLRFHEAAPPLFLWLEKGVSQLLGDEPLAMRLPAFLASCLALLLMVPLARRLLPGKAAFWAVLLFAGAEQLSYHACEAKPYAIDVLVATLMLLAFAFWAETATGRLLLAGTLLAPVLIFLSYPACFLYGGLLLALVPVLWRSRRPMLWLHWGALGLAVGVSFLALLLGPARAQRDPVILECWASSFPNYQRWWTLPLWAAVSTVEVGRYCFKPLGQLLIPLAVLGALILWRNKERVAVLMLPAALALVAGLMHRYPYGGFRVMMFMAPALALLIGAGARAALLRLEALPWARGAVLLILLIPWGGSLLTVARPWEVPDTLQASADVQSRFRPGDVVIGNDWTHLYYFRHLKHGFCWQEDGEAARPTDRLWAVWTMRTPAEQRWQTLLKEIPPGWQVVQRREYLFTTVVLAEPATTH
jgi:hypothetical protein